MKAKSSIYFRDARKYVFIQNENLCDFVFLILFSRLGMSADDVFNGFSFWKRYLWPLDFHGAKQSTSKEIEETDLCRTKIIDIFEKKTSKNQKIANITLKIKN